MPRLWFGVVGRLAKTSLVFGVAIYYAFLVFNNVTDYDSNYQFVRHVLMMDTTFPGNRGMWRAIPSPWVHLAFYFSIIAWEIVTALLCWIGVYKLLRALRLPEAEFHAAKRIPIAAL